MNLNYLLSSLRLFPHRKNQKKKRRKNLNKITAARRLLLHYVWCIHGHPCSCTPFRVGSLLIVTLIINKLQFQIGNNIYKQFVQLSLQIVCTYTLACLMAVSIKIGKQHKELDRKTSETQRILHKIHQLQASISFTQCKLQTDELMMSCRSVIGRF